MEEVLLNKTLTKVEQIGADLNEFKEEMHDFKIEMYGFKEEVYQFMAQIPKMFDKYTKETAMEINELAELISRKFNEFKQEGQMQLSINNKEHIFFGAQIEKLQISTNYIESKIHI